MVDLLCGAELQPFYEQVGMHRAVGVLLRSYEHQAGAASKIVAGRPSSGGVD
jgi:hypothetical protein